jgi:hypothetical protein
MEAIGQMSSPSAYRHVFTRIFLIGRGAPNLSSSTVIYWLCYNNDLYAACLM